MSKEYTRPFIVKTSTNKNLLTTNLNYIPVSTFSAPLQFFQCPDQEILINGKMGKAIDRARYGQVAATLHGVKRAATPVYTEMQNALTII